MMQLIKEIKLGFHCAWISLTAQSDNRVQIWIFGP